MEGLIFVLVLALQGKYKHTVFDRIEQAFPRMQPIIG